MKSVVSTCLAIAALFVVAVPSSAQLAQSPINISKEATVKANLPKLSFSYTQKANLTVKNTGAPDIEATIKALVLPGAGSVTVSGTTYNLLQFHFHTPSEHAVDGEEMPTMMATSSWSGAGLNSARRTKSLLQSFQNCRQLRLHLC